MLEQLRHQAAIRLRIPGLDAVVIAFGRIVAPNTLSRAARAVRRLARHANLHTNMPITLRLIPFHAFFDRLQRRSAGMAVGIDRFPALAAEELIRRQAGSLAKNVPEGHIDAAEGIVE